MLPATPQFVAFDRETGTGRAEQGYSRGLVRTARLHTAGYRSSLNAAVIPASLKSSEPARATSVGATKIARSVAPVRKSRLSNGVVSPKPSDFDAASDSASADLIPRSNAPSEVNAVADRNARPAMQRLLLVRDTQFVSAEFPVTEFTVVALPRGPVVVWSVQMMRVTFVAPMWREQVRMAAPKKI